MDAHEKTKYPNIFKNIYWGNFNSSHFDDTIIENRNKFVEEFNIKKIYGPNKFTYTLSDMRFIDNDDSSYMRIDHPEFYKTNDNKIIVVFSNYGNGERLKDILDFQKLYHIYSFSTDTYYKEFDNDNSFKKYVKNLKKCKYNKDNYI